MKKHFELYAKHFNIPLTEAPQEFGTWLSYRSSIDKVNLNTLCKMWYQSETGQLDDGQHDGLESMFNRVYAEENL